MADHSSEEPRALLANVYTHIVGFPDIEWSKSLSPRPKGAMSTQRAERTPYDTTDHYMFQMLADMPNEEESIVMADCVLPAASNVVLDKTQPIDRDHDSTLRSPDPRGLQISNALQNLFRPPFRSNQSIGRYIVFEPIGSGATGTVFKAYDTKLDRTLAIKALHTKYDNDGTMRLRREAQALAKLSHPNVVQVHDVEEVDGQTFIAMELVKGQTLRSWMEELGQPRPWRECLDVYGQAGEGLAAAHEAGIVHRDFKPDNAIIDRNCKVRVLDFGLARHTLRVTNEAHDHEGGRPTNAATDRRGRNPASTKTGTVVGTPAYMPPEQWRGEESGPHSDQFSFCVALYEALYGTRPFAGNTRCELMGTVVEGRVDQPDTKRQAVPLRVRKLLLRGLSLDPEQRWPSMNDLLAELRRIAAPRRRRYIAHGLAAGLAAMAASTAFASCLERWDLCSGAPAQLDDTWDDARRKAVKTAILATSTSYAPGTWTRVQERLDEYSNAWVAAHTEVCEATRLHGNQTEEAMHMRMRCLDKRRTSLRASVDELAHANAQTVEDAVEFVADLPPLAVCDDLTRLEQQAHLMPPPEDPGTAAEVDAVRERLANIEAMHGTGRYAEALDVIEAVVVQAEGLGYPPLRAEALYWRGQLQKESGAYTEAERDLRQAYTLSVIHHHDEVAMRAATTLAGLVGYVLARYAEGRQWAQTGALPLALRSGTPLEKSNILHSLGIILHSQGDYANAQLHHQQALEISEKTLSDDHPNLARIRNSLGAALEHQGEYESALLKHQHALEIWERALGPDHPSTSYSLNSLGATSYSLGDYTNAHLYFRRALEVQKKTLGPDHPDLAHTLNNLGVTLGRQGDYESARIHHQRAMTIWKTAMGPDHPDLAYALNNLGRVYSSQGDYESARNHYLQALEIRERALGPDHPQIATTLNNLGLLLKREGNHEEARAYIQRALEIWEKAGHRARVALVLCNLGGIFHVQEDYERAQIYFQRALEEWKGTLGPDHPNITYSQIGLAKVALEADDAESALAYAERAVSIREAAMVEPTVLADARFVLAQALWSKRSERARARTLAEQAREAYAKHGQGGEDDLAEIMTWLAEHHVK